MLASIKKNYHNHQFHRHSLQIEKTTNHHNQLNDHQERCSTPTPGSPQRSPTFFNKHYPHRLHLSQSMPKLMPPSSPTVTSVTPRQRVNESIVLDRSMLSLLNLRDLPGVKVCSLLCTQ